MPVTAEQKLWLLAPLLAYPVPGTVEYLPIEFGPANEMAVRDVMNQAARRDQFLVMLPPSAPLVQWTFGRFAEEYEAVVLHPNPLVVRFERRVRR